MNQSVNQSIIHSINHSINQSPCFTVDEKAEKLFAKFDCNQILRRDLSTFSPLMDGLKDLFAKFDCNQILRRDLSTFSPLMERLKDLFAKFDCDQILRRDLSTFSMGDPSGPVSPSPPPFFEHPKVVLRRGFNFACKKNLPKLTKMRQFFSQN